MDDQAGAGLAHLAGVQHHPEESAVGHQVEFRVRPHDGRALATQLQGDALAGLGGGDLDQLADAARTGEGNLADIRVPAHRRTHLVAMAVDHVEHPRRQQVGGDLGEARSGLRGQFRRLDHHRVARRQGRNGLGQQQQQRKVPGGDQAADANGLLHHLAVGQFGQRPGRQVLDEGVVLDDLGHGPAQVQRCRQVEAGDAANRAAGADGLQVHQLLGMRVQALGQGVEQRRALFAWHVAPGRVGGGRLGCGDSAVDIRRAAGGELGNDLAGGGIVHIQVLAAGGRQGAPGDEMLDAWNLHAASPVGSGETPQSVRAISSFIISVVPP
ncbi:hypothetical protein D3C84_455120 [compost metagenome]